MLPAVNPMLLQHTLRGLCTDSQWVYAVFWRILPRNYPPPQCVQSSHLVRVQLLVSLSLDLELDLRLKSQCVLSLTSERKSIPSLEMA
jgi:hypothetical protein